MWGLIVSFLGSLPLGTLNVTAMQISLQESTQHAYHFLLACILIEMTYVRISLIGINWIRRQTTLFKWMEWITVFIVGALAVGSFLAALNPNENARNVVLQNGMHRFFLGLMMASMNPVQIPFWFGWSTVLFSRNILQPRNAFYNLYIAGIGIGTFLAGSCFIWGGPFVMNKLDASGSTLNWIIGGIFSLTACILVVKILLKRSASQKVQNLGEMPAEN